MREISIKLPNNEKIRKEIIRLMRKNTIVVDGDTARFLSRVLSPLRMANAIYIGWDRKAMKSIITITPVSSYIRLELRKNRLIVKY